MITITYKDSANYCSGNELIREYDENNVLHKLPTDIELCGTNPTAPLGYKYLGYKWCRNTIENIETSCDEIKANYIPTENMDIFFQLKVEKGTELPSAGGIGNNIFYFSAILLFILALVIIFKNKNETKEE